MKLLKMISAGVVAALLLAGASGCAYGTTGAHMGGSRAEVYTSLDQLIGASSAIITGEVAEQVVVGDSTRRKPGEGSLPVTISTVSVVDSYSPSGLGGNDGAAAAPGDVISVRQMGQYGDTLPYQILKPGTRYLLFLVPSGLEGEAASDFYIVGGSAGIYTAENDVYVHVPSEEEDTLPERLTSEDLK